MSIVSIKTEPTLSLTSMMYFLRALTEPACVVHVGVGRGVGEVHAWQSWGVPVALLIDADVNRLGWAKQLCAQHPGWKISSQFIANQEPEVQFHFASNPDEDSLVPMQLLTPIWANIRTVKAQVVASVSLDQVLSAQLTSSLGQQGASIWCLIDCLPADSILLSAEMSLARMSVVVARVLLTELPVDTPAGLLSAVAPYLEDKGFKCLSVLETTHPLIGYAVFVRDYKATHEQYVDALQDQLQIEQVNNAQQREQLSAQQAQLDRLVIELSTRVEIVTTQSTLIEAQKLEIDESRLHVARIEAGLVEADKVKLVLQGQQMHLHDELVRAEAQIALIKDLIFTSSPLQG